LRRTSHPESRLIPGGTKAGDGAAGPLAAAGAAGAAGAAAETARAWDGALQWLLGLVAFGVSVAVFSRQIFWPPWTKDFPLHIAAARALCRGSGVPLQNFLFDLTVCALAAPVGRAWAFEAAALAVATAAVVAKVVLTFRRIRAASGSTASFWAALGLLFAMPLFNWWKFPDPYLGQISPNVWHNPPAIVVLPLALMLFAAAARLTITDRLGAFAGASALALLNCMAKVNYLLALVPCWSVLLGARARSAWLAGRTGWRRPAIVFLLLGVPVAGALAWQAVRLGATGGGVAVAPLTVWRLFSPDIPASILLSIAFPASVLAFFFDTGRRPPPLVLAWSVLLVAVLQMALLAETGPRSAHGNFFWGAYTANYLLFVESAVVLATAPRSWRSIASWSLLGGHALVGLFYAARLAAGLANF
jgi:hypothetical protein